MRDYFVIQKNDGDGEHIFRWYKKDVDLNKKPSTDRINKAIRFDSMKDTKEFMKEKNLTKKDYIIIKVSVPKAQ